MPPPSFSLRKALQSRLLHEMIHKVGDSQNRWKVLIVDRASLQILASAIPINTLVNDGITIVEHIDMSREPLPRLPALYFLTPTPESIQLLSSESPTQYLNFSLFFTSRLPDFQMDLLRQNAPFLRRVRALVELDVPFLSLQSQLFSFARPGASIPQLHAPDMAKDRSEELSALSERLTDMCKLVAPDVQWSVRSDATSAATRVVASLVLEQLETARTVRASAKQHEDKEKEESEDDNEEDVRPDKATLLIVDRATDLISPLVHEFSYQAIVHDLLKVDYQKPGGAHLEAEDEAGGKKKAIQLDNEENDPVWTDIRGLFVEEALKNVQTSFKDFLDNDAAFKIRGKDTADVDIKDMSAAVRSLPASQMMADKYAMHIRAAKECLARCEEEGLIDLAVVEQDLLLGRMSDGMRVRPDVIVERLTEVLADERIPVAHRVRVVLIALIVSEGLGGLGGEISELASSATFRAKLLRSGFDEFMDAEPSAVHMVQGLKKVLEAAKAGYQNVETKWKAHGDVDDTVAAKLKHKYANRQALRQQLKDSAARRRRHGLEADGELAYDVARYNPPLRSVMMDLIDDKLDKEAFPATGSLSVNSIIAAGGQSSGAERAQSERTGRGRPGRRYGAPNIRAHSAQVAGMVKSLRRDGSGQDEEDDRFCIAESGHVYLVFMLGGVCYSEVRALQEVCDKREANIVIGGSSILTPAAFMDMLGAVADPVTRIRVMLPPLPIELALSRAARAKALEAGRAKQKQVAATNAGAGGRIGEDEEGREEAEVEVVTGYKKNRTKRLFGRKKK